MGGKKETFSKSPILHFERGNHVMFIYYCFVFSRLGELFTQIQVLF